MVEMWQKSEQQQQPLQRPLLHLPAAVVVDAAVDDVVVVVVVGVLNAESGLPAGEVAGDECAGGGAVGGCVLREEWWGL